MSAAPELRPLTPPPSAGRARLARLELGALGGIELRARTFWTGAGGMIITLLTGCLIVALLVGWVLMWIRRSDGLSLAMLTLGSFAFALVLAALITLLNRLRAQFRLRQAEAAFLTGMSHNLRTPISAIRAAAQTLQQPGIDEDGKRRLVGAIVSETRRLGLRVDNVLEAGRLEVEILRFAPEAIDLVALVCHSVAGIRDVVVGRGGTISTDHPERLVVEGDPRALHLLVDNLLDNALTYSSGAPQIQLVMRRQGAMVWLGLRDQGIGLAPGIADGLFRRFTRADTGRAGTGLGLALARAIARGHGGEVHLSSPGLEQGALAELWLPLAED